MCTGLQGWYETERFYDEGVPRLEEDDFLEVRVVITERREMRNVV